jgi:hypothetical protein
LTAAAREALSGEAPSLLAHPRKIQIRTRRPTAKVASIPKDAET